MSAEDNAPAIVSWKRKSGSLAEIKYTPKVFDAPKISSRSLWRTSPRIWERMVVDIIIKAAVKIFVCLARRRLKPFFRMFAAMLCFIV